MTERDGSASPRQRFSTPAVRRVPTRLLKTATTPGLRFRPRFRFIVRVQNPINSEKIAALDERMAALGISDGDLLEKFVRGSGAGGQKINKTSNCVFLKHLPTGVCIKCQMDRSREMNRFLARRELCDQLDAIQEGKAVAKTQAIEKMRRTNRPRSRNSKKRSVADKRNLSQKKSNRRPPSGD